MANLKFKSNLGITFGSDRIGIWVCVYVWSACTLSRVWHFNPMDYSLPSSSVHGILQARILEWVVISKVGVKFSSIAQSCVTLCDPTKHSMPGLPVHHQLLEPTQTHVHWVSDAIQPSHPLSSPSPPALNLSQHQGLLNESSLHIRWPSNWSFSVNISSSNEHPGMISFRMDWLDLLAVKGFSRVFSNTTVQKHQFVGAQLSL